PIIWQDFYEVSARRTILHKWFASFHDTPQRVNGQIWFGAFCFVFMSEVDTRNRYASFEAIFCSSKLAYRVC
ncbi:hypothetical protein QP146_24845, partial [Escherichia coli]|nr:hypothetical protein [Escherichia coli]